MTNSIDPSLEIGQAIAARYEVGEQIGAGGFAAIFKAVQIATGQDVAIKILRVDRGDDAREPDEQIERFLREMHLCAELHHPNIVPLLDFGETEHSRFCVFQYVPGWNLSDVLAAESALNPEEAVHLMTQVIDAVSWVQIAKTHGTGRVRDAP